ncbi:MAG TPA: histidine phosphatase family protein [Oscillospiraceae bacterium]|nr:histidine phosphatase family protein [Oscillospiraceae bacterium]
MKGYRLSIIRHGKTEANETARYIGTTDLPLSESGRNELIEKYEINDYPKIQKVYSSPLIRCKETAEIIFPDRELMTVDGLREIDFGDFENQSVEDLIELDCYKEWLKGGIDNAPPDGESIRSMIERSYNALNIILADMMKEGLTHCGIVTHSGIIMNMLSCFGLPKMKPMEFACEVGEGYEIIITAKLWQTGNVFEILGRIPYISEFDDGYDF